MTSQKETAWAIATNAATGDEFISQEFFGHQMPPFSTGITPATFHTREIARKYLPEVKTWFPHAKVVKVEIILLTE